MPSISNVPDDIPVVTVDRALDKPIADFGGVDNELGIQLLFEHLVEQGVTSVGYAGTDDATTSRVERWQSFHRLVRRHDIEVGATCRVFSVENGGNAGTTCLATCWSPASTEASSRASSGRR
ncbi:hypothetical protein [Microbacterium phyllosphaerae]|uniref:hypothetical protein n=1 Tax=Microbacterium phyllosphaerae TaxID=124798 RepID=UPI003D65B954